MGKRLLVSIFFIGVVSIAGGQKLEQTVRGVVTDETGHPLVGASIQITDGVMLLSGISDDAGNFLIEHVPTGRYKITASFLGHYPVIDELLVIAGREGLVKFQLKEAPQALEEVEVKGAPPESNEIGGIQTLSIEKTMRVPANFFDPVRMITSYPGVVAANDQANSIIIKGNSPNGLLWRLNGLDIVNPNHLANAGTLSDKPMSNGGGVNILSAQMLDRTTFYTGSYPANYGNALGGVVDMKLRSANKVRRECTAQASLLGLDVSAEGPLMKGKNTSFLANYRYSTVGLLSKMGVNFGGEVINFQDFSFTTQTAFKDKSSLSFFGFGGISTNDFKEKEQKDWKEDKDHDNIYYKAQTFAIGLQYIKPLTAGVLEWSLGYSSTDQNRKLDASPLLPNDVHLLRQRYTFTRGLASSNLRLKTDITKTLHFEVGIVADLISDKVNNSQEVNLVAPSEIIDGRVEGILFQPYASLEWQASNHLKFDLSNRFVQFTYNQTHGLEPRAAAHYFITSGSTINLSYGVIGQQQQAQVYVAAQNKDLQFSKSRQLSLSWNTRIAGNGRLMVELYDQSLYDVPVSPVDGTFSVINLLEGTAGPGLISAGKGSNTGATVTMERSFFGSHHFMIGGSYYDSRYKGYDGVDRDSRFNGHYTANATYGKEWVGKRKNRTFGISSRALLLGGLREGAIDVAASKMSGVTVYDLSKGYAVGFTDYFRIDLRLSIRKNTARYTRTLAVDIQNLTGQQNEAYHYYDFTKARITTKYQLGLIPVIVYRFDF